jgi:PAS domain S-box-containing protein
MAQPSLEYSAADLDWSDARLFRALVASSDDAIVAKSLDGVIVNWNPGAVRMYGYTAEESIGQPMAMLCPPDRKVEIQEILASIRLGERVAPYETVRVHKDGTTFAVSLTVSPIDAEGGSLIGASSIARDLTEQEHLRAELLRQVTDLGRANRDLESFTYSVAHDLRSPLRAVSGFSTVLLEECGDSLSDDGRSYAGRIIAASEQMATLIDDLLSLSRMSRAEMHVGPVDLGAEAAQIAEDLQRREPDRRVRFAIQRPVQALADPVLIRTVLQNLLDNAWKFTSGRDDASIEFGTTSASAGDARLCCYVRDNGVGFDPAYADKLFQPFQRLHTIREFPGTGVGLASVRQIVERHGGQVRTEAAVGKGATFYFTLNAEDST